MRYSVSIVPRASRTDVAEMPDGGLRVHVTAPPVDGKANEALVDALAEHFDVPKSSVHIVSGLTGKRKVIEIRR